MAEQAEEEHKRRHDNHFKNRAEYGLPVDLNLDGREGDACRKDGE